ncbi:unnamed protein product, partial [Rotaria magnacalcarata]
MSTSTNSGGQQQTLSFDNTATASSTPLPLASDPNDNNNSERLKQQTQRLTHHLNGLTSPTISSPSSAANVSSSNGH